MLVFEKNFIETLLSFGFEHESIETALCLCSQKVLPNSPIYGKEFHLLGNGIYIGNFIDSLWLDHTIPKYDSCYAYYKTFDAHCTYIKTGFPKTARSLRYGTINDFIQ